MNLILAYSIKIVKTTKFDWMRNVFMVKYTIETFFYGEKETENGSITVGEKG